MALIDTTNTIDNSIFLKTKLDKNMVGSNYWIDNLQQKRNAEWLMRYNVVDIEEELQRQLEYSLDEPNYTPIEAIITNVKNDEGEDESDDWAKLKFKDLKHPCDLGSRYRFPQDIQSMEDWSEEEKHYDSSIWICFNKSPFKAGNACMVRRCNGSIMLAGSPTKSFDNITEYHEEPVVLVDNLKYMQIYSNETLPIPQGDLYVYAQLNYYTNCIKINNRFIIGGVDLEDRENNFAWKVKAVIKSGAESTFLRKGDANLDKIPLVIIALDKDPLSPQDDLTTSVASECPVYSVSEENPNIPVYEYFITLTSVDENNNTQEELESKILMGETEKYCVQLNYNGKVKKTDFTVEFSLINNNGDVIKDQSKYYEANTEELTTNNTFTITNKKPYKFGALRITCSCTNPLDQDDEIVESFDIKLGGFY